MMHENFWQDLTSKSKKVLRGRVRETILDIVVYGSSAKGKGRPGDIDVMVIFHQGSLRERLELTQKLRGMLQTAYTWDVKSMLLSDFWKPEFLARQGVLLEGISVLDGRPLADKVGFEAYSLCSYQLSHLTHTKKVSFNYALHGRYTKGIIFKLQGKGLGPGVVLIPIRHSLEFEEFLTRWDVRYKTVGILASRT